MKNFDEPVLLFDDEGISVIDDEILDKINNKNISPSMITGITQCPSKWVAETFVIRDMIEQDPSGPAMRGTLFHKVMEDFFALPKDERTKQKLKTLMRQTLDLPEFEKMKENKENISWLINAVKKYYDMGAKPQLVDVAQIPKTDKEGNEKIVNGLEIFVKGKLGKSERNTLGFIDRLVYDNSKKAKELEEKTGKKSVIVEDWKGLALNTIIPTPNGYTTIEKLKVKDKIFGSKGQEITVVAKSKIHNRPCYTITLSDKTTITCDNIHLWKIEQNKQTEILTADELYNNWKKQPNKKIKIKNAAPIKTSNNEKLEINPYYLGLWLANTTKTQKTFRKENNSEKVKKYITKEWEQNKKNKNDRHIPIKYLRSKETKRIKLIQGIMDQSGEWDNKNNNVTLTTENNIFAKNFRNLLQTFGITPNITHKNNETIINFTPTNFNVFTKNTKPQEYNNVEKLLKTGKFTEKEQFRYIENIEKVKSVPTQCIKVNSEDSLFLCGETLIPTHNTGEKPHIYKKTTKSDEGLPEQRQQLIYKMILENEGYNVSAARLIYPVAQTIVNVDFNDEKLSERVVKDVEETDKKLSKMINDNVFPPKPSYLCAWCPIVKICKNATVKPYKKMQDAYATQPEPETLKQAIETIDF